MLEAPAHLMQLNAGCAVESDCPWCLMPVVRTRGQKPVVGSRVRFSARGADTSPMRVRVPFNARGAGVGQRPVVMPAGAIYRCSRLPSRCSRRASRPEIAGILRSGCVLTALPISTARG